MLHTHFTRYLTKIIRDCGKVKPVVSIRKEEEKKMEKVPKFYNFKTELFNLSGKEESW
jgi:hypothetical protein